MSLKLKEFFDTVVEIRATVLVLIAIVFEFHGFDDYATTALIGLAVLLYGYIRRVEAGPFKFNSED